jgi:nitrogen regulatory protein PII
LDFRFFLKLLGESFRDLLPIAIVILFFQLVIIQSVPDGWSSTLVGLIIVGFGLAIFLQGLEIGIFPIGEKLAKEFAKKDSMLWLLFFGFMIGFGTTIAEPALVVIADKASLISSGRIDADILRYVVAFSVGFAIFLGVLRIIKGYPIHYYIIGGYILAVTVTFFAPPEIIGLSYDLGGVTTSTVTVPLVAALGIGLASNIKGRDPVIDGFGLIAFASLTPIIFVQIYGISVYTFVEVQDVSTIVMEKLEASESLIITTQSIINGMINVLKDIFPILFIILFFQYGVIKKNISNLKTVITGFILVVIGLYAFILGLELGLFSLGEKMAHQLTQLNNNFIIYSFAFAIGFATTMAEPALMAIAKKSKKISNNKINDLLLRVFVAIGVAIGISIGAFRIIDGGHLHYYIIVGYILVIILTSLAPKYIIPIAYDSGGVTTSTVTVPLVAALGLGLATNIPNRSALIDGFGLIAFASLFPMITVMLYGIIIERINFKIKDKRIYSKVKENLISNKNKNIHTVNIDTTGEKFYINFSFMGVAVIVPEEKREEAVVAAKEGGATGVTILDAQGLGLSEMDNFYRMPHEKAETMLLFIVPETVVESVLQSISDNLHITTTEDGIAFSFPISQIKGISLRQQHIFQKEVNELNSVK